MNVLHVISGVDPFAGGPATALLAMTDAQRRAGLDVAVAHTFIEPQDQGIRRLQQQGVVVHSIGPCRRPLSRHPDLVPTMRRLIPHADVIHIHSLWEEIQHQAARISRQIDKPHVITAHGMLDPWSLAQGALKKRLYLAWRMRRNLDCASAIHFTTTTERELVAPMRLRARILVEPNGVDLAEFGDLPPRGTFRARYPQLGDRPVLLFLGRLNYKKGFDLLIPAFARVASQSDVMLVIAGPDDEGYGATIAGLIDRHVVPRERVLFTGMLRDRARVEAFVDADLFVLPSYQENFGIAVVEALAAGCPVVISDQVNICHEVREARVGAVVPAQAEPLAQEILRWLNDAALRRDASGRAIRLVRERYDWNQIARRWIGHYERLIRRVPL